MENPARINIMNNSKIHHFSLLSEFLDEHLAKLYSFCSLTPYKWGKRLSSLCSSIRNKKGGGLNGERAKLKQMYITIPTENFPFLLSTVPRRKVTSYCLLINSL